MDRLTELELLVYTAELGTLSKAAGLLEISTASATRHLAALEQRLNVRLIERNTRRLSLTPAGHEFVGHCKNILSQLREAETSITTSLVEPSGTLTITASISFSMLHIAPILPAFKKLYPQIKIKILGENRYDDIIDNGIDLAIRTREFEPDSNITIRRLAQTRRVLAASPEYLRHRGTPKHVEDLCNHDIMIYNHAHQHRILNFSNNGKNRSIKIDPLLETNDGQIARAAAIAGAGILVQPKYIVHDDLIAGRLIPVLDEWRLPDLTINMAFQERRYLPARTRIF
ncbi:LysR family transcriptional regulator, partial [Pseudomonas agarici]